MTKHFRLTEHIVAFSGGLASAVTAEYVKNAHPDKTTLLYHSTNTEPADNDRFRAEVANYLKLPITEDSDGRNIWDIFKSEGYLGNGRNTMCSRILKQDRSLAYIKEHQPAILYFGFTVEEYMRAQRTSVRYKRHGIETRFPLVSMGITKKECENRVVKCWRIKKPDMYKWASHANCVPCIKGKKTYWGLVYIYERQAWERASQAEEEYQHTIFTDAGSLRDELDDCLRLATDYIKKRENIQSQMDLFNFPCDCAT